MTNLNKDSELESFIKDKVLEKAPESEQIFILYIKAITSSIKKLYTKFKNTKYSISCCESIHSIFWIILNYSNNLKLTMFLCERAIILYQEYIELSININETLNLKTIKLFIYKKSIGSILVNTSDIDVNLKKLCLIYKDLVYATLSIDIKLIETMEEFNSIYLPILYKLFIHNQLNFIENVIYYEPPSIYELNKVYFKLTLYNHTLFNIKTISKIRDVYNILITDDYVKDIHSLKELKFNIDQQAFYSKILEKFNLLNFS
jgi:hypothetical protein